jgi:cation diffusion facilitator CzcD-associated flavoprotein CzcO
MRKVFPTGNVPSVAVIGAGFGGIAAAVALKRAGVHDITIYDKASGVGGTWWLNRYPGAEVDTPSVLYSYSFRPGVWSRTHVKQAELQSYMDAVVKEYGLDRHLRLSTQVIRVAWDDARQRYDLTFASGEIEHANVVVSAVGLLDDPRYPEWPGLESFAGPVFHTARWEDRHDLAGKRVVVVGTGSTAAQLVPNLAPIAQSVTLFQRDPGWVVPKFGRDLTSKERTALGSSIAQRFVRTKMMWERDKFLNGAKPFRPGTPQNSAAERVARGYIDAVFKDRPEIRDAVTPKYPYGGKRPIIADDYYPALLRDNVKLVPRAVTRVTPTGVVDVDGVEHEADVLILATGFKPADFLSTLEVVGPSGASLQDVWKDEPEAFLGLMVPGFPNFFMLYGPNTNGGAIVTMLELQAKYVASAVAFMARWRYTRIDVKQWAMERFNKVLQQRLSGTVWAEYENNYYKSPQGKIVTQWPEGAILYGALTKALRRAVWRSHRGPAGAMAAPPSAARSLDSVR